MRRGLVAGNWKMNGSKSEIDDLLGGIKAGFSGIQGEVAVCPPFVYLDYVNSLIKGTDIKLGAQNLSEQGKTGAFTGEIFGSMLKDCACDYVIVGHSERRTLYGEDDALVAKKFAMAQELGLIPIFCIGETLEEREANKTEEVVSRQVDAVIELSGVKAFNQSVMAYEPVWAIGTGKTATPQQAQDVHAFLRQKLAKLDGEVAQGLRILYGGSVNAGNADELFAMEDIDGGLIGGASLKAGDFLTICKAIN